MHVRPLIIASTSLLLASCGSSDSKTTEPTPTGTELVRETLTGSISASSSPACSGSFQRSVDPSYYAGGTNYRQSIAANRCCETIDFVINPGTKYAFVIYLRGVDPQFLANGGRFSGDISTSFTLVVERPK